MKKYIIENEKGKFTAVLISPDYGAGYSTWGGTVTAWTENLSKNF